MRHRYCIRAAYVWQVSCSYFDLLHSWLDLITFQNNSSQGKDLLFLSDSLDLKAKKEVLCRVVWRFPLSTYNVNNDAAFCNIWMPSQNENKFLASTKRNPAFITKGFSSRKNGPRAFMKHQGCDCLREGMESLVLPRLVRDVCELLSPEHDDEKTLNRNMLLKLLQTRRFFQDKATP